ncbi:hypothetical protein LPJ61_005598 [Coemansia biformis]|uniref:Uncharacterized protein n=1 Tax=Coemansia biformis TaxID=1286918 RepID=A0A9W7Y8J8_9FUNG|nr:hypothetical protein LPJ61_005598 [Coemansia biformis]
MAADTDDGGSGDESGVNTDDSDEERMAHGITDGLISLIEELAQLAPNIRRVGLGGESGDSWQVKSYEIVMSALRRAYGAVGTQTTHLRITSAGMARNLAFCPPVDTLRSIVLSIRVQSRSCVELIRRNVHSLEELRIDNMGNLGIDVLVCGNNRLSAPLVYPCLKCLDIGSYGQPGNATGWPAGNPFPSLEALRSSSYDTQPFVTTVLENRACLRHLDIAMSRELVKALRSGDTFGVGALPNLCSIALWAGHLRHNVASIAVDHLASTLELCPRVRAVCFQDTHQDYAEVVVNRIHLPPTVQYLDIATMRLTVDQAAGMICACSELLAARLSLRGTRQQEDSGPPTLQAIQKHRKMYRTCTPGVHRLELVQLNFVDIQQSCEGVLQLVDVLPRVRHVTIETEHTSSPGAVVRGLYYARRRSVYAGRAHLTSIRFVKGHD